jgi:hypothetical protein
MTTSGRHETPAEPDEPSSSLIPQRKVSSGALGGAVATVILWAVGLTGVSIPSAVAAAIATVVVTAVAYLVPGETA